METKCKILELNFNETLQSTLKEIKNTILSEVGNIISNQIEVQITKQIHIINDNVAKLLADKGLQGNPTTLINDTSSIQMNIESHFMKSATAKQLLQIREASEIKLQRKTGSKR